MISMKRRQFIRGLLVALSSILLPVRTVYGFAKKKAAEWVNDIHSRLNRTRVLAVETPRTATEVQNIVKNAKAISVCGSRHAMGAQQFGTDTLLIDVREMNKIESFDPDKGLVKVQAGIEWPELIDGLLKRQKGKAKQWGIFQKQTGADKLTIAGALAANAHGRQLNNRAIVADVEEFELVNAKGDVVTCGRKKNSELFGLAIGGYGLFGVITSVTLRLSPRQKVRRVVEITTVDKVPTLFKQRIKAGFTYGDFQFGTDEKSQDFLRKGVFSCYIPVKNDVAVPDKQKKLSNEDWGELISLAHFDKKAAFDKYASYYKSTSGQVYWSDTHQLSTYLEDYHLALDKKVGSAGSEMISELYVPRNQLSGFLKDAAEYCRKNKVNVIYGTVRLIKKDTDCFLTWAKKDYACIIFNLHVTHTAEGLKHSTAAFRRLIDLARKRGGSYFLTYHKWATKEQVEECYPNMKQFLELKLKYDPSERFQSDWYRHYKRMFL